MYKIENFSFTYPKDKKIIKDISFEIKKGDFLVITGKSGCGKTTLLRYLKPSLRPKGDIDGVIILDEEIENRFCFSKSRRSISYEYSLA